jgi:oligopeptide/dipeptide ABC transporter ATP-binding protein
MASRIGTTVTLPSPVVSSRAPAQYAQRHQESKTRMSAEPVIEARDLRKWYPVRRRGVASLLGRGAPDYVKAVDGVSISIAAGEIVGLVGESGSGKSTTGMALLKLHAPTGGEIRFQGLGLLTNESRRTRLAFRRQAQIVFQNPYEALNPRHTIGQSVGEPLDIHFGGEPERRRALLLQAMERSGLLPAADYLDRYPHQLSGGQLQRVAIARAISVEPRFLVADEPVSMLDVSIRAGILNLLRYFANELNMAILYISHDLSTMRHVCGSIAVMYRGRIIERGPADSVLDTPSHPYTQALVGAIPVMRGRRARPAANLIAVAADTTRVPSGCRFHPRCPHAMDVCRAVDPALDPIAPRHEVACHLHGSLPMAAQ